MALGPGVSHSAALKAITYHYVLWEDQPRAGYYGESQGPLYGPKQVLRPEVTFTYTASMDC